MAVSVTLSRIGAVARLYPLGLEGPGNTARAVKRLGAFAGCRGIAVKLEREANWASQLATWSWVSQITAGNRILSPRGSSMARQLVKEGESVTLWSRPTTGEGSIVYASDVETVLVSVFDTTRAERSTPVYEEDMPVSSVMHATLQLDKGWRTDAVGYTFKYELPAGILIEGGRVYRVEAVLRTFSSGPRTVVFEVETAALWTSRAALGV